ncbi:hypothetical protein PVAND_016775 [Polypedilum vanderplanki]|uniref:Glucuronosyltransferase n=1 Tax=Polypedilum vanderplanki TaxID=319348 RepID=A0A9J6BGE6_POLVA|nr:hypothetical protein PVAND_016775 [Polypedilum vanderplanki]
MKVLAARGHNLTIFTPQLIKDLENSPNVVQYYFVKSYEIFRKNVDPLMFLAEINDCPIITSSALNAGFMIHGLMGNDINPALYSETGHLSFLNRNLNIMKRIESLLFSIYFMIVIIFSKNNKKLQNQFFIEKPVDIDGILQKRSALLLTNTNVGFGHIRPLMPNTVQVGFMHVEPPKEIKNKNLKEFLDNSTNGIIVMSLGSKADTKSLNLATVNKFLNVFNQTKFNVVWKSHESDQIIPQNVMLCNWLPLADVLAHKNVKLLINHSGLMSSYEAIDREIPMIVFPLAYDHHVNAKMMVHKKIAIELDLNNFSEENLLSAIDEVTKGDFKENVKKLREKVYDQPIKSLDLAV